MATIRFEEKLKEHIEENGIQKTWFARKIGVTPTYLYHMLAGRCKPTKESWAPLIALTRGKITLADILECVLRDSKHLMVRSGEKIISCEIAIVGMEGFKLS